MIEFILSKKFYLPIIYIVVGVIIYFILCNIVNKVLNVKNKHINSKKQATIINLIKSIIKYLIFIIIILMILTVYGVNTTSIIASLGIVGVVIGLAFQDILKNLLAGISIIFDNQYMVGDIVGINGFKGEVISLGLQTTKIKAYSGEVLITSNSLINSVINYSVNNTTLIIDLPIAYNANIDLVEKILLSLKEKIENIEDVKGNYTLLGVDSFNDSSMTYKIMLDCTANMHFGVKRKILKIIKETFDSEKIEIPYNKLDVYLNKE